MSLPSRLTPCLLAATALALACNDDSRREPVDASPPDAAEDAGEVSDAEPAADASSEDASDADAGPATFGGLTVDTSPADQALELFDTPGHRFWFEVSEEQRERMNERRDGEWPGPLLFKEAGRPLLAPAYGAGPADVVLPGPIPDAPPLPGPVDPGPVDPDGDIYTPGELEEEATFADHLVVQDAVSGSVADYGKIEVALVGESTFRGWTRRQIPNLRVDADEFQQKLRVGGFEHLRFNNGLVGSIFREHVAHRVFRALGYPALRSTFAFIGSNVWGPDVWVPMTLSEVYKRRFCEDNHELLGGTCENIWEFPGDAGGGPLPQNACQVSSCDDTRMEELTQALASAPQGPGFKAALEAIVDWPLYHAFQCIGWLLATGDDAVRATNNNLIIERSEDHRLVWAPYSVDISAGQDWHADTTLFGQSSVARGCQSDPSCWADAYEVCERLVDEFDRIDAAQFVDETRDTLTELGMMRAGDARRAQALRAWYESRPALAAELLPRFRYLPDLDGNCPHELVACNDGGCGSVEECATRLCPSAQTWCETTSACVQLQEECPACEGATPLYCPAAAACVADVAACSKQCTRSHGVGYLYCPATKNCELSEFCTEDGAS